MNARARFLPKRSYWTEQSALVCRIHLYVCTPQPTEPTQNIASASRFSRICLALVSLFGVLAPAGLTFGQTPQFTQIAGLIFTMAAGGSNPLPQVITAASTGSSFYMGIPTASTNSIFRRRKACSQTLRSQALLSRRRDARLLARAPNGHGVFAARKPGPFDDAVPGTYMLKWIAWQIVSTLANVSFVMRT